MKAYKEFISAMLYAALRGHFDFAADQEAYECNVLGREKRLNLLTRNRLRAVGATKPIFKKTGKGSRVEAQKVYAEKRASRKRPPIEGPMHLVKVDKAHAHFSDKRPKTISTPLGGEADNTAVFDA